jgi:arylformamidase
MSRLIDISPLISDQTAVFPGDTKFSRKVVLDTLSGDNITLSQITTTLHIGAHTDAPNHYSKLKEGISSRPLDIYYGPCQVFSVKPLGDRITLKDLEKSLEFQRSNIKTERILFRTDSFLDPNQWKNDFTALSAEIVEFLARKKVVLLGIDTPSIDPASDKMLEAHSAVAKNDMAILEGIILKDVVEGEYILSALPLKIKDADASPVRAILIKN